MWKTSRGGSEARPTRTKYQSPPDRLCAQSQKHGSSCLDPMSLRQIRLPFCAGMITSASWSSSWASPHTVPATSGGSAPTDSALAWQRSGDAKFLAEDARRDGSDLPFNFPASTRAPEHSPSRGDQRFRRRNRLTRGAEIQAVTRIGVRAGTSSLDVRVLTTTAESSRVGFVVPKYGRGAVERNQLKRRLRELTRVLILGALRASGGTLSLDVVIRARPNAYDRTPDALRAECEALKGRLLRLLPGPENSNPAIRIESRSTP